MSKKLSKQPKNKMEIDIDSLLVSEDSAKDISSPEKASTSKGRKKLKNSNPSGIEKPKSRSVREPEGDDEPFDISKTVQNFKNDFAKPTQVKKILLEEFTHQVVEVYQGKAIQLRKKQVSEEKELRGRFAAEIHKELEKWKEDMSKMKEEEEKIVQMLVKHLKIMDEAKNSASMRKNNLLKIAKSFDEEKKELVGKHESEIGNAFELAKKDISELQMTVIADIQKKEKAALQRLLCRGVFF